MVKAVVFDMFETLVTYFDSKRYKGTEIAADINISEKKFREIWDATETDRTLGHRSFDSVIYEILKANNKYSESLFNHIICERKKSINEVFNHMNYQIVPMLKKIKDGRYKIGLVTNCYIEEAEEIKKSALFEFFDITCFSCELGVKKPDIEIFKRCLEGLGIQESECLYIGDGGCEELETVTNMGIKSVQATWYLKSGVDQPTGKKIGFNHVECPLDVLEELNRMKSIRA